MSNDFNTRFDFFIGLTTQSGNQLDVNDVIQDHVVPNLAAQGIDGFTVTRTEGYWKGQREHSFVVTVFDHLQMMEGIWPTEFAQQLARELDQECILVSATPCTANLI
jgi:hypothetical protein